MSDVLVLPSTDLTPAFTPTQSQKENSLEGQMLQKGPLKVVQIRPLSAGVKTGRGSRMGIPFDL